MTDERGWTFSVVHYRTQCRGWHTRHIRQDPLDKTLCGLSGSMTSGNRGPHSTAAGALAELEASAPAMSDRPRVCYMVRVASSLWLMSDAIGWFLSGGEGSIAIPTRFRGLRSALRVMQAGLLRYHLGSGSLVEVVRGPVGPDGRPQVAELEVCWTSRPNAVDQLAAVATRRRRR